MVGDQVVRAMNMARRVPTSPGRAGVRKGGRGIGAVMETND